MIWHVSKAPVGRTWKIDYASQVVGNGNRILQERKQMKMNNPQKKL